MQDKPARDKSKFEPFTLWYKWIPFCFVLFVVLPFSLWVLHKTCGEGDPTTYSARRAWACGIR
mgnify:CR=1 FL=1